MARTTRIEQVESTIRALLDYRETLGRPFTREEMSIHRWLIPEFENCIAEESGLGGNLDGHRLDDLHDLLAEAYEALYPRKPTKQGKMSRRVVAEQVKTFHEMLHDLKALAKTLANVAPLLSEQDAELVKRVRMVANKRKMRRKKRGTKLDAVQPSLFEVM